MKKRMEKIFLHLLCIVFLSVSLGGCKNEEKENHTNHQAESENVQASFENFLDQLFVSDLKDNIINLHYTVAEPENYGIEDYTVSFGDFEMESYEQAVEDISATKKNLEEFSYEDLKEDQQVIYDILMEYLTLQEESGDYILYEEPLAPTSGIQTQLPILLGEYIFRCDRDVEDYLEALGTMEEYFESLFGFEKRKAEAGFFMNDTALDNVLEQCSTFIKEPQSNMLITSFNNRMDVYKGEKEKVDQWKKHNEKLVLETVIPAYEGLIKNLETLRGKGENEGGLCHFDKGKEYYEYLLQYSIGTDKSADEMKKMIEAAEKQASADMVEAITKDPALIQAIGNCDITLEEPVDVLNDLKEKIGKDFPKGGSDAFEVKFVDKSMEDFASPAFYLTPAVDDISSNVIYINQANKAEDLELYTTLAHEGYPGHLYQETFFTEKASHPVRKLLSFGGYTEGWGIYAENYGYQYADISDGEKKLYRGNFIATLCLYSKVDLGIHYEGWDLEETAANLALRGITDRTVIEEVYDYIVAEPGNYLKYFVGYLEIMELKDAYKKYAGETYTEKDFHIFFLEEGPMSFPMLHKRLGIKFQDEK